MYNVLLGTCFLTLVVMIYFQPGSEVAACVEPFEKHFKDLKRRSLPRYPYKRDFGNPAIFNDHVYTTNS